MPLAITVALAAHAADLLVDPRGKGCRQTEGARASVLIVSGSLPNYSAAFLGRWLPTQLRIDTAKMPQADGTRHVLSVSDVYCPHLAIDLDAAPYLPRAVPFEFVGGRRRQLQLVMSAS